MMIQRFEPGQRMSQAVKAGGFMFVAGQVADGADAAGQAQAILDKIDKLLAQAGMDRRQIVSANIWISDIEDFGAMNAVWDNWVPEGHAPARACVQSELAMPRFRVEIAVIAFAPEVVT